MNKNDLYHILIYRFTRNTFALLEHNLSHKDSEEIVNELHEQKLPAFRGRQTAEHAGLPHHCSRCKRATEVMIQTQRQYYALKAEEHKHDYYSRGLGPTFHALSDILLIQPARQVTVFLCCRCGEFVEVDKGKRANVTSKSMERDGLCAVCAMTRFLLASPELSSTLIGQGRGFLLKRDFQQVIGAFLVTEGVDFAIHDVDWQKVYDRWKLPFPRGGESDFRPRQRNQGTGPLDQEPGYEPGPGSADD